MSEKLVHFSEHRRPRRRKCPICGRPPLAQNEPFCSKRCADEDLRRWLTGGYRIPTKEVPEPDGEGEGG
ncbi:MAG TPA: DNA gyrase inhibitor YacG [Alphaproteobacteria bacterium]|nr:DNA gyrase inhibitor YacG [Alphaproteobacteria bacterium]